MLVDNLMIRNALVLISLVFLFILILKKEQEGRLNWSLFYSVLWLYVSLAIVNYLCVQFGLWRFSESVAIKIPYDLFFVWGVFWGIVPFYFLRGKYWLVITLVLFWLDIILMPQLQEIGLLELNDNWLIGEFILLVISFIPSYLWARFSYYQKFTGLRALFQVVIMGSVFMVCLPYILYLYGWSELPNLIWSPYLFQLGLVVVFPSLVAVNDLVKIGRGTPFPYDKTSYLVRTGVYAYCRNPIQWSFTFMFIPMSIYFQTAMFLIGTLVSIAYTVGVSDYQEYSDLKKRFGKDWVTYISEVPKWYFLWKPKNMPKGVIYFQKGCNQCEGTRTWFYDRQTTNLSIEYSSMYVGPSILQVTYIDYLGNEYKSVEAIAYALEHINLGWASLGWLMRMPGVNYLLQAIVDTMEFTSPKTCEK